MATGQRVGVFRRTWSSASLRASLFLLGALSLLLSSSCNEPIQAAHFVAPVFGEPCDFTDCGGHGSCQGRPGEAPRCLCEVGYQGQFCASCEAGFHRDAEQRCVSDRTCAMQSENPCGHGGACVDADGVISCACHGGYEGPRCTLCVSTHGRDADGLCLPLSLTLDSSGPVTCTTGHTGPSCTVCASGYHLGEDRCVPDQSCSAASCSANANCRSVKGEIECSCKPQFSGLDCADCAPGFHADDGNCLADDVCSAGACPEHATCRVVAGTIECPCDPGHADTVGDETPDCQACANGYHEQDGACVPDQACGPGSCPATASCAVVTGTAQCICLPGYAGPVCADCEAGFHKDGATCVLDEYCELNSCPLHATCTLAGGLVTCPCDPGWGPAGQCDLCESYATERTGFEFPTGWPTRDNLCLTHVELSVSLMTFRSRFGTNGPEGVVWQCARSTFSKMDSQHVELEANALRPATLTFEQPAHLVAFDFGSRVEPIAMEVRAHDFPLSDYTGAGRAVATIHLEGNRRDSLTLVLDPPARVLSLWSLSGALQHVAIDDMIYSYPQCR